MAEDVLIRGARVVDGTGNPWFYADLLLRGETIAAIAPAGSIADDSVASVVDAEGMVVCPGFIDILSHSTIPLMVDQRCLSKIKQGVTTEIMGEGWTPAPHIGKFDVAFLKRNPISRQIPEWVELVPSWTRFRDWLEAMQAVGVSPNIGAFLGGGTLRIIARGMEMGQPTDEEIATMRRVTGEAMEDGAMGVSQALIYPPSAYSDTEELVEVCEVASRYNGIYITHLRSEADSFLEAMDEALEIGRRAQLPVEIYHLKAAGKRNWHKAQLAIDKINQARGDGIDVTADMYPYTGAGTGLTSVLPPWVSANNRLFKNLRDPEARAKVRKARAVARRHLGGNVRTLYTCGRYDHRTQQAGKPAICRQDPGRDQRDARSAMDRLCLRSLSLRGAAN